MLDTLKNFYENNKKAILIVGGCIVAFVLYKKFAQK